MPNCIIQITSLLLLIVATSTCSCMLGEFPVEFLLDTQLFKTCEPCEGVEKLHLYSNAKIIR